MWLSTLSSAGGSGLVVRDVETAPNGAAAVRQITAVSPDVIPLDLNMPIMSGLDVLECLNQHGIRIPVVIATQEDDIKAADVGAVAKLSKPFEVDQLVDAVAVALRGSPQ